MVLLRAQDLIESNEFSYRVEKTQFNNTYIILGIEFGISDASGPQFQSTAKYMEPNVPILPTGIVRNPFAHSCKRR